MRMFTWLGMLLFVSVLLATQSYAGGHPAIAERGASDHHDLAMYYEEEAQKNKSKALDWEFAADYFEKFPDTYTGKMKVSEHIASLREAAADFRKTAEKDQQLASKHRAMMRQGVGP
ncbi:MAG: hypothetical protein OEV99_16695 [Nitrospira sp.]|nr:hypothetical protein [Nitrospira sp.]MDH5498471.1 hypothetical protein [Nitrospira sp.]